MKTVHKLALAAGLPAVAIATFGSAASAAGAAPTTTTTPPGGATTPAGWQNLVDDTGTLTLAVPPTWTDLDLAPGANADGSPRPWLEASTDIESFHESFETAGAVLTALPHSTDLQATLDEFDVGSCADQIVEPYTDGEFTGLIERQDCGSGIEYQRLAVDSPANPSVTLLLQIGVTSAEEAGTADAIIASMAFAAGGVPTSGAPTAPTAAPIPTVPGATAPAPTTSPGAVPTLPAAPTTAAAPAQTLAPATVPGTPTVAGTPTVPGATTPPVVPVDPGATTVAGQTPPTVAGAVQITDDTGLITLAVPPTWTDVSTTPRADSTPWIVASTNRALFLPAEGQPDTFSVPGVSYQAVAYQADTATVAANFASSACTDGGVKPYSDGVFTGHFQANTDCGGTSTRMYAIVASPADASFTAVLLIQVTEPGEAEINTIIQSFNYGSAG